MREKWNCSGGFTLVETLCAVTILALLCLMMGTGIQAAVKTYREITAKSETQLLLNTLVNAISDELRCAHGPSADGDGILDIYNGGSKLTLSAEGRILTGGRDLLPAGKDGRGGAYRGGVYQAEDLEIRYDRDTACFTLSLKVVWRDGDISTETPEGGVVIRCLNPPEEAAETQSEGGAP